MSLLKKDAVRQRERLRQCEKTSKRTVPGFCTQAYQKNTVTAKPAIRRSGGDAGVRDKTSFALNYGSPGFPLTAVYGTVAGKRFRWLKPVQWIDYEMYMPILADGIREPVRPLGACATYGLWDMLEADAAKGDRVLAALPRTVFPLRKALDYGERDWSVVVRALKTLQKFAAVRNVGPALVPYYRQLLPPINWYTLTAGTAYVTATDGLDGVVHRLMETCSRTLSALEEAGSPCAYTNIKYVIPTYENTAACRVNVGHHKPHTVYATVIP